MNNDHHISVTYTTEADNGEFSSNAILDLHNFSLIHIDMCEDQDATYIEHVFSEYITIKFDNIEDELIYPVIRTESQEFIKPDEKLLKIIDALNLKNHLQASLILHNKPAKTKI